MHHAAAENDFLRRGDHEDIEAGLGEVVGLNIPGGVVGGEIFGGGLPAVLNGRSGGESFEAVFVKGAMAFEMIVGVAFDSHVSHFGMARAVNEMTIYHDGSADSGADGEIGGVFQTFGGAPGDFSEKGGIDVGVENGGNIEGFLKWSEKIGVGPTGLWRCRDMPVGGRIGIEVGGPEGADGQSCGLPELRRGLGEEVDESGNRFFGCGGGDAFPDEDVIGARSQSRDHFGAAGFEGGDERSVHEGEVASSRNGCNRDQGR